MSYEAITTGTIVRSSLQLLASCSLTSAFSTTMLLLPTYRHQYDLLYPLQCMCAWGNDHSILQYTTVTPIICHVVSSKLLSGQEQMKPKILWLCRVLYPVLHRAGNGVNRHAGHFKTSRFGEKLTSSARVRQIIMTLDIAKQKNMQPDINGGEKCQRTIILNHTVVSSYSCALIMHFVCLLDPR